MSDGRAIGLLGRAAAEVGKGVTVMEATEPFSVLKAKSPVNERAKAANDDPRFSVPIR